MQQLPSENDAALAERVMDAAHLVAQVVRREVRRRRPAGLSVSQVRTLTLLARHAGSSLAEVAENAGLGAPAASRLVDDLVRGGLVTREPAAEDRRRIALRLLPEGQRVLKQALSVARAPLVARIERLSAAEKAKLSEAIAVLQQALVVEPRAAVGAGSE